MRFVVLNVEPGAPIEICVKHFINPDDELVGVVPTRYTHDTSHSYVSEITLIIKEPSDAPRDPDLS